MLFFHGGAAAEEMAALRHKLDQVTQEKEVMEKEFMDHLVSLTSRVHNLRDEIRLSQEQIATSEEEKQQLLEELEVAKTEGAGYCAAGLPPAFLAAVENIRGVVMEEGKYSPRAMDALKELDEQISIMKETIPRNMQPKQIFYTEDVMMIMGEDHHNRWKESLPKGCTAIHRSACATITPSEDRSTIIYGEDYLFVGIYDGHSGDRASEFTSTHLFDNFRYAMENGNRTTPTCKKDTTTTSLISDAFEYAYKKTDLDYLDYARTFQHHDPISALFCGTCCITLYVDTITGRVTCSNLGDSRAVMGVMISSSNTSDDTNTTESLQLLTVPISSDHRASCQYEQDRIRKEHPGDEEVIIDINKQSTNEGLEVEQQQENKKTKQKKKQPSDNRSNPNNCINLYHERKDDTDEFEEDGDLHLGYEDDNEQEEEAKMLLATIPDWRVKKLCAFTRSIGDLHMKDKSSAALFNSYVRPEQRIVPRPGTKKSSTRDLKNGQQDQQQPQDTVTLPYISNDPENKEATIKDGFIIIASGGVWDEIDNDEAVLLCAKLISKNATNTDTNIADLFIEEILKKIVERLNEYEDEEPFTLEELKSYPLGERDGYGRSSLHDEMTVIILQFSSRTDNIQMYNYATTAADSTTNAPKRQQRHMSMAMNRVASIGEETTTTSTNNFNKFHRHMSMAMTPSLVPTGDAGGLLPSIQHHVMFERRGSTGPSSMANDAISKYNNNNNNNNNEMELDKEKQIQRKETNKQIIHMMKVFDGMNREQIKILFDVLDINHNGVLEHGEVKHLVSHIIGKDRVTPLLLETAFYELDNDSSGSVSFMEFCDFFGID